MNVFLWIVQGVLAAVFLAAGSMKLAKSHEALKADPNMAWTQDFSGGVVKAIGALEILAAVGLILPWLTGIAPVLTPLAALGLVVLQLGAFATHLRRGEMKMLPVNAVLFVMAALVAWQRYRDL
ncbi:DoxX family protein [Actinokineospora xionganensis]|uniref:DoxX family protein n=1 Tax=Actinokineospora xionganensis TaxID=2684470 RepID=A0ABR7LBK7_9PSEU|nr:DoxX family protein [Actinokineospora xionganensis]MBC6450039.1 DoxX family protein [Actinokineospora xionganensis]